MTVHYEIRKKKKIQMKKNKNWIVTRRRNWHWMLGNEKKRFYWKRKHATTPPTFEFGIILIIFYTSGFALRNRVYNVHNVIHTWKENGRRPVVSWVILPLSVPFLSLISFPDGSVCLWYHLCVFNSNKKTSSTSYCCRLFAQTLGLLC